MFKWINFYMFYSSNENKHNSFLFIGWLWTSNELRIEVTLEMICLDRGPFFLVYTFEEAHLVILMLIKLCYIYKFNMFHYHLRLHLDIYGKYSK